MAFGAEVEVAGGISIAEGVFDLLDTEVALVIFQFLEGVKGYLHGGPRDGRGDSGRRPQEDACIGRSRRPYRAHISIDSSYYLPGSDCMIVRMTGARSAGVPMDRTAVGCSPCLRRKK